MNNSIKEENLELSDNRGEGIIQNNDQNQQDQDQEQKDTWNELPSFALEKHHILFKEINVAKNILLQLTTEANENEERVNIMNEHLKNVNNELMHTEELSAAKTKEIETESHMKQLSDREIGRINADIVKADKLVQSFQDKLSSIQSSTYQSNEKLEQFKLQMNYNAETLEQWALAAKQKDEDSLALAKYMRADEDRIRSLNNQIESLSIEATNKKHSLEIEITETQAGQIELDRTAEEFRTLHFERQTLIQQWDEAIKTMARRDEAILHLANQIATAKETLTVLIKDRTDRKDMYEREVLNGKQSTVVISAEERKVEKSRLNLNQEVASEVVLKDELEVQRSEAARVTQDNLSIRNNIANLLQTRSEKEQVAKLEHEKVVAEEEKWKAQENKKMSAEERIANAEQYFLEQKSLLKSLDREQETLKDVMFKQGQELFKFRKEESQFVSLISGTQAATRNLNANINDLDNKSIKQQEMLYNIEFQVQQLERKVARASGKRSSEETIVLNKRIAELQEVHDEKKAAVNLLNTQVKRVQDDCRKSKRDIEVIEAKKNVEVNRLAELSLENDILSTQVKSSIREKEEIGIQHDLQKLEVRRLTTLLSKKAEQVVGMKNRKAQMQLTMEERIKEIEMHRDLQRLDLKTAMDDKHRITVELNDRLIKVDKLRQKYAAIAGKLQGSNEEEHSQAFYIINSAQERQELQREGDELNDKIKVAEKEIRYLQRALLSLTEKNVTFRDSFKRLEVESDEVREQLALEEEAQAIKTQMIKKRSYLREIATDFEERRRLVSEISSQTYGLRQDVNNLAGELHDINKNINDTKVKRDRASNIAKQKQNLLRKVKKSKEITPEETSIQVREVQSINKSLINFLVNFCESNPEVASHIQGEMATVSLNLPLRPLSVSSRASSVQSIGSIRDYSTKSSARSSTRDLNDSFDVGSESRPTSRPTTASRNL